MPDLRQSNIYSTGTYAHAVGTSEDDVKEYLSLRNVVDISFDMSGLLQDTTIRIYEKVDESTYRLLTEVAYPDDFDAGVDASQVTLKGKGQDMRITFQSGSAEAGIIDVEWTQMETPQR